MGLQRPLCVHVPKYTKIYDKKIFNKKTTISNVHFDHYLFAYNSILNIRKKFIAYVFNRRRHFFLDFDDYKIPINHSDYAAL